MVCTPLLNALRVEIVAFVTREGSYHIVSLEVLQANHALLHLVMLLIIKYARQLAEVKNTVHTRRTLTIVRICRAISNIIWTAFFLVCLIRIVNSVVAEQKSATKDHDDNREDAKHYHLVILEEAQDNANPIYQPVTFMRAPDPFLDIAVISFFKVSVAHNKQDGVKG